VREARGCEVRVKLGGFTLLRPNTAAMSCCFSFWDGGGPMDEKFDFIVLTRNRDLTSREECLEFEKRSGKRLNPSYVDFISQNGPGKFRHFDSSRYPVYSLKDAIEVTGWYSEVIVSDIENLFSEQVYSTLNPGLETGIFKVSEFIDPDFTHLLKSATVDEIFVYNHDANDIFFSIDKNPEHLFCSSREGEIHLIPDGYYNLFRSIDFQNEEYAVPENEKLPKMFYREDLATFFSLKIQPETDLELLRRTLDSRVHESSNFYNFHNEEGIEIADLENVFYLGASNQGGYTWIEGFFEVDPQNLEENVESYLRQNFSVVE
jgi:hypothetical protein